MTRGRRVPGAIRFLVNVRGLQLECAWVLHETLFVTVLIYSSETMIWKEKISIRELCRVTKGLMKVFSYGSAMWREWRTIGLLRGIYVCECAGSRSEGSYIYLFIY